MEVDKETFQADSHQTPLHPYRRWKDNYFELCDAVGGENHYEDSTFGKQ